MTERSENFSRELRALERRVRRQADLRAAGRRVWESLPAIVQIVAAVAAAYALAHYGLGHAVPLLAVTVTINSLGFARDARPIRVAETFVGILLGVVLGDVVAIVAGRGLWQVVLVVATVMLVARFMARNPSFAIAAAVPSAIVVMVPDASAGTFTRSVDALIGGVMALLVTALIPRDPRRMAEREGRALFSVLGESLGSVVDSLRDADWAAGDLALTRLRRTQPMIDAWALSLDSAVGVARISPWVRRNLPELERAQRIHRVADLTARHLRTIARRTEFLVRDCVKRPELADVVTEVAAAVAALGRSATDASAAEDARERLTALIARLTPATLIPGAPVADAALLLAIRPLVIDLLDGAGMDPDAARALLPPV